MKLLLDQGLPRSAADLLRAAGIDAVHTGELGLSTATDIAILDEAVKTGRYVVTLDADFHALLALSGAIQPSVVRIRIQGLRAPDACQLLQQVLPRFEVELKGGAVVTINEHVARVRSLPLA